MSTQPIIIQVTDQVDPNIAAKIQGIGVSALSAATSLGALKTALASVNSGVTALNVQLQNIPGRINPAVAGTNRLTGAFAQLISRVVGAEAGVGMLGGAFGRVGVAAGLAGPLIIAGLAIGAVAAAVLIYEKFEEAARKLVTAQESFEAHIASQNDKLLKLNETLVGLTQGPLAKYRQELLDLPHQSLITEISEINKVLDAQKSHWADLISLIERYSTVFIGLTTKPLPKFDIQDAKDFIAQIQLLQATSSASGQGLKGLQDSLTQTGAKLVELHNIEQSQGPGRSRDNTEVARKAIQDFYNEQLKDLDIYNAEHLIKLKGANGELLSEQKRAAAEQLKEFNDELSQLRERQTTPVTPAQVLNLRQQQLTGDLTGRNPTGELAKQPAFKLNVPTLDKDIGNSAQTIARSIQQLTDRYKNAQAAQEAYSEAQKEANAVNEINQTLLEKGIPLYGQAGTAIRNLAVANVANAEVNREQVSIYQQFQGPLDKYFATIVAASNLLKAGTISQEQANVATNQAARAREDALNPLNEYLIGLSHEIGLLDQYGRALTVATEVDRVRQGLQQQGYDLSKTQITTLSQYLTLLDKQKEVQSDLNALWEQNAGNVEKLLLNQQALNKAVGAGVITESQYKLATVQTTIALADQAVKEQKNATLQNQLVAGIGKYIQGYQGLTKGISDAYGQAFTTIADGAANSIGRALAYAENLGDALKDVARQALSELIAGFVKLGIQLLVTEIIGHSVAAAATAATAVTAASTAAAWAPAAAFASLATLGANAAPAAAAISGTVALSDALALVKFEKGGPVYGPAGIDRVPAMLTNGEYIVNASATARNRSLLDSINSGANSVRPGGDTGGQTNLKVQVVHDGSTRIDVQQLDEHNVRVIAQYEAKQAVQKHAPSVVASDLQNPNSRVSKAVNQNIVAPRKR